MPNQEKYVETFVELIRSALDSAAEAESIGLGRDRIILSCKVSDVQDLIAVYGDLATRSDHALHLGLIVAVVKRKTRPVAIIQVDLEGGRIATPEVNGIPGIENTPQPAGKTPVKPARHGQAKEPHQQMVLQAGGGPGKL